MTDRGSASEATSLAIRDRYLAPSLYSPFAEDMARRLTRISASPLLDIMADTGVLAQVVASALPADVAIVATDPDPWAVERGSAKPGMSRVSWQRVDPLALPFKAGSFGVVTCLLGVAMMPERTELFREVRRVLRPEGRFMFTVLSHIRHNPVAASVEQALVRDLPDSSPRFLADVLHGYHDSEAIDDDLTGAGFTDAAYTAIELPYAAASAEEAATGYCLGTAVRHALPPRFLNLAVESAAEALRVQFGRGRIASAMRGQVVLASG